MSVKYAFNKGNERLFGTAYEFGTEAEKDQVLALLRTALGENVTAVRSFASGGAFELRGALAWLRSSDLSGLDFQPLEQALAEFERAAEQRKAQQQAQAHARAEAERRRLEAVIEQARQREQARLKALEDKQRRETELAQLKALAQQQQRQQEAEQARKRAVAQEWVRQQAQLRREQEQAARGQARAGVRERCVARNIQTLTHFTRLENVQSILAHGLIPHAHLNGRGIINDYGRYDRKAHANCLSITSPNYRMFFRYRKEDESAQWAVLLLDPALLWELDCGYTEINAADNRVSGRTDDEIRGPEAFERLFGNQAHRDQWRLTPSQPTNPQAEVLCFDTIPARYITAIHLQQAPRTVFRSGDGRVIPHTVAETYFLYRHDWEAWR